MKSKVEIHVPVGKGAAGEASSRHASSRAAVKARTACVLTQRDIHILYAVAKLGMARTSDVRRLFFGSKYTCLHRLQKLVDSTGYLGRASRSVTEENVYYVTAKGFRFLQTQIGEEAGQLTRYHFRGVEFSGFRHFALVNTFRIHLVLATQTSSAVSMPFFKPDWEIRKLLGNDATAGLVPDALFGLRGKDGIRTYALEMDRATESVGTLVNKVNRYASRLSSGYPILGLSSVQVVLATTKVARLKTLYRRVANLASMQTEHSVPTFLGCDVAAVSEENLLNGPVFYTIAALALGTGRPVHLLQTSATGSAPSRSASDPGKRLPTEDEHNQRGRLEKAESRRK